MIIHSGNPCCGHLLRSSLNLSYVSNRDSNSICMKEEISFRSRADFPGGKYLAKKASAISSQVVIDARGNDCSHYRAFPFNENEKARNLIASSVTPLIFSMSHTSKKFSK